MRLAWSGQLADSQVPKLHGRPLRLEAKITKRRLAAGAARHFLAVHPESYLAINRPNIIMVPLAHAFAQMLARETAHTSRRRWRKRRHLCLFCRKYVAVRREPVGFLFSFALIL